MSKNLKKSEFEGVSGSVGVPPPGNLSATALARRKMILTSLGKGSAVVAAASVPMHSLAAIGTLSVTASGQRCSISGTMSAVHSNQVQLPRCTGRRPSFYSSVNNWPNYSSANPNATNTVTGGSSVFRSSTLFNNLFGSGPNVSLLSILNGGGSDPDAIHWVTALLNGTSGSAAGDNTNFPYTAQQVIDLYNNPARRTNALNFFITYMETV